MPAPERRLRVLVVDDQLAMAEMLVDGLEDHGYEGAALDSGRAALEELQSGRVDALVTDLRMPDVDGLELLAASRRDQPTRPVIVMTAFGAIDSAVESIRQGAWHYLTKPFKLDELLVFLERALQESRVRGEAAALKTTLRERFGAGSILGQSPALLRVLDALERVAQSDVPVLLLGETGTGKSLFARALHAQSPRSAGPFVSVNCAALPETLLESELFGHVRGAFTGATQDRAGLVVEASGGVLFLDEIAEMSPAVQAKLLHVLEGGVVRPVGSGRERTTDVRVIAATHRDLRQRVKDGSFRQDLLYRLEVVPLSLPALRDRPEDLPLLIAHFLEAARRRHPQSPVESLSPEVAARLLGHAWPGNVRELAHLVERLVLLGRAATVELDNLPVEVRLPPPPQGGLPAFTGEVLPVRELQRRYAQWALAQCGGKRGKTAEKLGVDGKTLARWLDGDDAATES